MEEDFEFGSPEEQKISVDRYEEMLRNEDQYFFDAKAFESIIDYYITKNDPIKNSNCSFKNPIRSTLTSCVSASSFMWANTGYPF